MSVMEKLKRVIVFFIFQLFFFAVPFYDIIY